jgi:hypothetical protein
MIEKHEEEPAMGDRVQKQVMLAKITEDDARAAAEDIENLCKHYRIVPRDRDSLWKAFACFCTHLLLKNGELPGGEGDSHSDNGRGTD